MPALGGVLDRVADQVGADPVQLVGVADGEHGTVGRVEPRPIRPLRSAATEVRSTASSTIRRRSTGAGITGLCGSPTLESSSRSSTTRLQALRAAAHGRQRRAGGAGQVG